MNQDIMKVYNSCPNEIKKKIRIKKFKKEEMILEQGYNTKYCYVLLNGKLKVYKTFESGEQYLQNFIEGGHTFGEIELMNGLPCICNVKALTDCEMIVVDKITYENWIKHDHNFAMYMINSLGNKLYYIIEKTSNDVVYTLEQNFSQFIYSQYKRYNALEFKFEKGLIAERFATSIRSLNRIIYKFKQNNILEYREGKIIILDLVRLTNFEEF